ncbi:TPA: aldehyde oxidoreductase [Patescibacteria group bacterium]|uniref:Aldehyde reductase n=1 Tax=Candidatus Gottesmanbacteria bacterium GW2011_GWA1_43_11 TaxID=1618436 RepID=A0A0G1CE75_9BACT|nr:MAG: Aldehyde reductase [Candidatus Gottesmanbacteria bacterium GW2011_GWA1_43_11]HCS79338.1 aldehyde oxidoreductase [Patescibacteria group bacterium]
MSKKKFVTLNNNYKIPVIGLGTWRLKKDTVLEVIEFAINIAGYRHVDCASIYGNEIAIGNAFHHVFSSGKVKREDVFVTSKLWNTEHHPKNVEKALRQSLNDLQLDYLDLYLMHWGIAFLPGNSLGQIGANGLVKTEPVSVQQTWQAMENLVAKGLVKSIGVANFTVPLIIDLLTSAKIKPVVNQVEIHPYNTQEELVNFCHKQKIQLVAYSPFGSSERSKHPKPLTDELVDKVATSHHKTPAQILIRWALQRGLVVIPKSAHPDRIQENIHVFNFELSSNEMERINNLNRNLRFIDPVDWWGLSYFK